MIFFLVGSGVVSDVFTEELISEQTCSSTAVTPPSPAVLKRAISDCEGISRYATRFRGRRPVNDRGERLRVD